MRRSPNRMVAIVAGAAFVVLGIAGFFVTSATGFADPAGGLLFGVFSVNGLQNVVDILIGAALLMAGLSSVAAAKTVNSVVGTACLLLGLAGLFVVGGPFNVLAINGADNVLHFGAAALLLAVGTGAERPAKPATA